MSRRGGYKFEKEMRERRKEGLQNKCEQCGKESNDLTGHHIVRAYVGRTNPALAPNVIKDMANLQMLCPNCHKEADAHNQKWDKHEIAVASWALFDKDPKEVEENQGKNRISNTNRKKKRRWGRRR